MASPMPRLAPVTIAILFSSNFMGQIYIFSLYEPPEKFAANAARCFCDRDIQRHLGPQDPTSGALPFRPLFLSRHRHRLVPDNRSGHDTSRTGKGFLEKRRLSSAIDRHR